MGRLKLPVLCPQEYVGMEMRVTTCTRCPTGWNKKTGTCKVDIGIEHLPLVAKPPRCPMEKRCQHQLQLAGPCPVRARGMICESALVWAGKTESEAANHPKSFHAMTVVSPEEWEEREAEEAQARQEPAHRQALPLGGAAQEAVGEA